MTDKPSPEVRDALKSFCDIQRKKYGPDWKRILAKEMAEKQAPVIEKIFNLGKTRARN